MPIDLRGERRNSRLSLGHFFLWFAVASVLAATANVPLSANVLGSIALDSAAITAALLAIYQAMLNSEWGDAHPGHWCAMVVLWVYVDRWLVTPQLLKMAPQHEDLIYAVFFLGASILFFLGMLIGDWGKAWKVALAAHGVAFGLAAARRMTQDWGWRGMSALVRDTVAPAVDVAAVALVLFAVLLDFWWKELRDWKHWVGLVWFGFHWVGIVRTYVLPHLPT